MRVANAIWWDIFSELEKIALETAGEYTSAMNLEQSREEIAEEFVDFLIESFKKWRKEKP